jgi:preprotein translocase subunit SecD
LFVAIGAVGVIIFARYRSLKIAAPILITSLSEVLIIFGIAALIKWNIDLAAIAGILATVGTGVDAQIVITDEVLEGKKATFTNWKERLKRALFIIFGSYATVVAAMIPLWGIGAGLLKGFAIVTIIGATIGVFITRQAYAKIIEALTK